MNIFTNFACLQTFSFNKMQDNGIFYTFVDNTLKT